MSGEANVRSRNETDQHRDGAPPPAEHEPQIIARAGGFDWADRTGPGRAARSVVVIASGISSQLRRRRRRRGRLRRCSTPKKNPPAAAAAAAAAAETEEIRAGAGHPWTVDRAKGTETSG